MIYNIIQLSGWRRCSCFQFQDCFFTWLQWDKNEPTNRTHEFITVEKEWWCSEKCAHFTFYLIRTSLICGYFFFVSLANVRKSFCKISKNFCTASLLEFPLINDIISDFIYINRLSVTTNLNSILVWHFNDFLAFTSKFARIYLNIFNDYCFIYCVQLLSDLLPSIANPFW